MRRVLQRRLVRSLLRPAARHQAVTGRGVSWATYSTSDASAKVPVTGSAYVRSVASDVRALEALYRTLESDEAAQSLERGVGRLLQCHEQRCRVFVTGMGKSGAVAQRLASTLTSVSVSSQYVHGGEWVHGELGGLKQGDVVVIVSHSGRTAELLPLPKLFHRSGCFVMTIVGDDGSPLSQQCDLSILAGGDDEAACPVPSRSIVVQEAVCNAIVQHLIECMDDSAHHLRESHPGGSIGADFASH